jgi:hypothetical protein
MKFITRWGEASPVLLDAIAHIDINRPISTLEVDTKQISSSEETNM